MCKKLILKAVKNLVLYNFGHFLNKLEYFNMLRVSFQNCPGTLIVMGCGP
jgi:hypothetical protein